MPYYTTHDFYNALITLNTQYYYIPSQEENNIKE